MHRRLVLAPFCVALLLGCGARSPLDGPLPADGGMHPLPVPLSSDCTSALLADAPAPLFAYCSTRTYLAPTSAPRSPRIAWSTALPQGRNSAHEMVVDPQGRIYALLNSPSDTSGDADAVAAFDPSGALLWMQPFTGQDPADLFLGADGQLRFLLRTEPTEVLVVMGTDGTLQHSYPLPVGGGSTAEGWPSAAMGACS